MKEKKQGNNKNRSTAKSLKSGLNENWTKPKLDTSEYMTEIKSAVPNLEANVEDTFP